MVKTDRQHTYKWFKKLVKEHDLQVNDIKQMWTEIDMEEIYADVYTR